MTIHANILDLHEFCHYMKIYTFIAALCLLVLGGCSGGGGSAAPSDNKSLTTDAQYLKMTRGDGFTYCEIWAQWQQDGPIARYAVVDSGLDTPASVPDGATIIKAPLRRSVVGSSVYTAGIAELGALNGVAGVADASYYTPSDTVTGLIASGRIKSVGSSMAPDKERVIDLDPDALLMSPAEGVGYEDLAKLGAPLIPMTDYLEHTPLGRAEWILFIGTLYNRYDQALEIYKNVCNKYQRLRVCAINAPAPPVVITERPMSGVWHVPGGDSYMAALLSDAYASYPWEQSRQTGSIPLDVSAVLDAGENADFWLIKDAKEITAKSLLDEMPQASAFKAFPKRVYVCNTLQTPYYNAVAFHPELILADLVALFHPGTPGTENNTVKFYRQIK